MRIPQLKHQHIIKLSRLLNMLYKPSEIAEEIGVSVDTVYRSYGNLQSHIPEPDA